MGSPTSSSRFAKTQTLNPLCKLVVCAVIAAARNGPISDTDRRLIHPDSHPCSPPTSKSWGAGAVSNRCQKEINLLLDNYCMLTHLCIECLPSHRSTKCSIFVGNILSFRVKAACFRPCPNASLVPPREGRQPWNRLQVATSDSPCDILQNTTEKHGHGSPWEPGRQSYLQTEETDSVYRSGSDGILPPSP